MRIRYQTSAAPALTAALLLMSSACRGTSACPEGQRFGESGRCVSIDTCPTGRDPLTGACANTRDAASPMPRDSAVADSGSDGGSLECTCAPLLCDAAGACVQCLDPTDCSPEANACVGGECVGCSANSDCTDVERPVCERASGRCGQCTPQTEIEDCSESGMGCLPDQLICGGSSFASRAPCQSCRSDAECGPGPTNTLTSCVGLAPGDTDRLCLVESDNHQSVLGTPCPDGYLEAPEDRTNTRGELKPICLPRGNSCSAIREMIEARPCTSPSACTSAFCDTTLERCTLDCTQPRECPDGFRCDTPTQLCKPE